MSQLDFVEKLSNCIKDFVRISTFIRSFGSKTQLFIHIQKSKKELHSEIDNAAELLRQFTGVIVSFHLGNTLQNLMEMKKLGEIHVVEKRNKSVTD